MAVSFLSLVPAFNQNQFLPWPLIAGTMLYMLGAFTFVANARGEYAKTFLGRLRWVRIGIFVCVLLQLQRMATA